MAALRYVLLTVLVAVAVTGTTAKRGGTRFHNKASRTKAEDAPEEDTIKDTKVDGDSVTASEKNIYQATECAESQKLVDGLIVALQYTATFGDVWGGEMRHPQDHVQGSGTMFDTTRGRGLFHTTFGHVRDKQSVADLIGRNIEGLCPGTKLLLTYTPEKAFGGATVTTQDATVPPSSTVYLDVEIMSVTTEDPRRKRNDFALFDGDGDGDISTEEAVAFLTKRGVPADNKFWAREDDNNDGTITWEEFKGPKGDVSPKVPPSPPPPPSPDVMTVPKAPKLKETKDQMRERLKAELKTELLAEMKQGL